MPADGIRLEANADEHHILTRMRMLQAAGVTLRGIAAALNLEGLTTRRRTPWRFQYVASMLRADAASAALAPAA